MSSMQNEVKLCGCRTARSSYDTEWVFIPCPQHTRDCDSVLPVTPPEGGQE